MLRHVLLALLTDGLPHHGYALMKAYAARSGVRLSIGNVYRELQRLVAEGLITITRNPEGADPRRTPYVITARGRAALATWLGAPSDALLAAGPDPLAYRLAVLADLEPRAVAGFLEDLRHELRSETKRIERERAAASERATRRDPISRTRALLLGRRARHLAVESDMLDEMWKLLATPTARRTRLARAVAEGSALDPRPRARRDQETARTRMARDGVEPPTR